MQLITYADRLGGNLHGLSSLLDNELAGLFSGVHVLPFFDPIDGADAGFDPIDHTSVDARLGDWSAVARLAQRHCVMADLIVNHISAQSAQFKDVRDRGRRSVHWPLFLKKSDVYTGDPVAIEPDIARVYRPRPGRPFTSFALDDGTQNEFWTTFSPNQIDINVETAAGRAYLDSVLACFARAGIREIRLDAAGYAIKRAGTDCFMLPETFAFIAALSEQAAAMGMQSLIEVHAHYQTQIDIAAQVGRVYDFALPPLVLHTLYDGDATALKRWLRVAPRNCVTVLDTHDGIGIVDVADSEQRPGLLNAAQIDRLVDTLHMQTYHGVLAPNSAVRALVTPAGRGKRIPGDGPQTEPEKRRAMSWAQRLKRVFRIDMEQCVHCGAAVKIIACIQDPHVIGRILDHLKRTSALGAGHLPQTPRAPPKALLPDGTFDLD